MSHSSKEPNTTLPREQPAKKRSVEDRLDELEEHVNSLRGIPNPPKEEPKAEAGKDQHEAAGKDQHHDDKSRDNKDKTHG
jgi:hypothetical protein